MTATTKSILGVFAATILSLALSGCARHVTVAPVAVAPPPVPPRPVLAAGLGAVTAPPRTADGGYATINAGIGVEQTVWHLRSALNVAAIGCRSPADAGLVPAYNAMLATQKAVLARANSAVQASFRARGGDWQGAHDAYMTRLYNFFAMPAAKADFCAAADTVALQAAATVPAAFPAFAQTAMPRLEAPFVAVYAAVDDYRVALAAWDARYGAIDGGTRMADATPGAIEPSAIDRAPAIRARLAYADLRTVIAWTPRGDGPALALR